MNIFEYFVNLSFSKISIWIVVLISVAILLLHISTKGWRWNPEITYAWVFAGAFMFLLMRAYGGSSISIEYIDPPLWSIPFDILVGFFIVGGLQYLMVLAGAKAPNMAYGFLPGSIAPVLLIFLFWLAYIVFPDSFPWVIKISTKGCFLAIALLAVTILLVKEIDIHPSGKKIEQIQDKKVQTYMALDAGKSDVSSYPK